MFSSTLQAKEATWSIDHGRLVATDKQVHYYIYVFTIFTLHIYVATLLVDLSLNAMLHSIRFLPDLSITHTASGCAILLTDRKKL